MLNKRNLKYLYIITMSLAMLTKIGGKSLSWYTHYFHCVIWIGLGLLYYKENKEVKYCCNTLSKVYLMQYIIFWIFGGIGYLSNVATFQLNAVTRSISNTLLYILIFWSVYETARIFKDKLFIYTFYAVVVNYLIVIVSTLFKFGIKNFIIYGLRPYLDLDWTIANAGTASTALETNDVSFATGFFLIYFLIWKNINKKKQRRNITVCLIIIYLGFKRIEIAAIGLVFLLSIFWRKEGKKSTKYWAKIITISVYVIVILYMLVIQTGTIGILAEKYKIDFMGRLTVFNYMRRFFSVSPFYVGRGFSTAIRLNEAAQNTVKGLIHGHSDILLNYIDFGFWGMLVWVAWCFYVATKHILKRHNTHAAKLWLMFTIYVFITYFTDNTSIYFATQSCYMVIMFHLFYTKKELSTIGVKKKNEKHSVFLQNTNSSI